MRSEQRCLHRARACIELTSPMMIATGQSFNANDNNLVRDENGWPMIPGTSITGVLRNLVRRAERATGQLSEDAFFGRNVGSELELSSLQISAGLVHNSNNEVREAEKSPDFDELLTLLSSDVPIQRNGVAIDIRGAARDQGKYDRTLVPAGTRFSFELSWWTEAPQPENWQCLLALLAHPLCTFGGGSRIGQGAFKLVSLDSLELDLTNKQDASCFRELHKSLKTPLHERSEAVDIAALSGQANELLEVAVQSFELVSENGWRVGGGSESLSGSERTSGLFPYTETRINWSGDCGAKIEKNALVMPGSAIKGAFSHRLEFHFRRLQKIWADDQPHDYRDTDIKHLLGWVDGDKAQVGHLWFSDGYMAGEPKYRLRTRNKIDRLTAGTIDKALFVEERVHGGTLKFTMFKDEEALKHSLLARSEAFGDDKTDKITADLDKAIELTLRDLKSGRLALGAGQNNGSGFFMEMK